MGLLIKHGILYFLLYVLVSSLFPPFSLYAQLTFNFDYSTFLANSISVLFSEIGSSSGGSLLSPLCLVEYVPVITLIPWFIMSIRELHAHDVQGRRGEGIDSGFDLSTSVRDAGGAPMVFADVEDREELDGIEEIPVEVGTAPNRSE